MTWLFLALAVVVVGVAVVIAVGPFDAPGQMAGVDDERPDVLPPPDRHLTPQDLDEVRFTTAVRGYRMDEVDAVLARLRAEWTERESGAAREQR
ncbi:DivIVA domain-containing protein [Solicola sp. PLA-1-18]|uniref:DivIVA domain-containing protein n=1 Tax=Solicola sp. PLA-1-18 TaxID=3380532 RepID=UPI003B82642E